MPSELIQKGSYATHSTLFQVCKDSFMVIVHFLAEAKLNPNYAVQQGKQSEWKMAF